MALCFASAFALRSVTKATASESTIFSSFCENAKPKACGMNIGKPWSPCSPSQISGPSLDSSSLSRSKVQEGLDRVVALHLDQSILTLARHTERARPKRVADFDRLRNADKHLHAINLCEAPTCNPMRCHSGISLRVGRSRKPAARALGGALPDAGPLR